MFIHKATQLLYGSRHIIKRPLKQDIVQINRSNREPPTLAHFQNQTFLLRLYRHGHIFTRVTQTCHQKLFIKFKSL